MKNKAKPFPEIKFRSENKAQGVKLPTWGDRCPGAKKEQRLKFDEFFPYFMEEDQLNPWLDQWLQPEEHVLFCLKMVDEPTADKLYGRTFNPITLRFTMKDGELGLCATIESVDDHYFGMHKYNLTRLQGLEIIQSLVTWVDQQSVVNGKAWWAKGKELGFDYQFDN